MNAKPYHAVLNWTLLLIASAACLAVDAPDTNARRPANDRELHYWLVNMIECHGFSDAEVIAATGLSEEEIAAARKKWKLTPHAKVARDEDAPLLVLPYPGGRHPRIGFLDGAVNPQRETKFSVFTPWDSTSYVVVDVPEAVWSNLGLTYLAHTHVPTIWEKQNVALEKLEWTRVPDGSLHVTRKLPNGIAFTTQVVPHKDHVEMSMTLTNGTDAPLSDLRIQQCCMLKAAKGFEEQTNDNKVFQSPYTAVKSSDGKRWIVYAWDPCNRAWGNAPCPCLHSDPKFPDTAPGQTNTIRGWLSFYEGDDVKAEFERIEKTGWRK